MRNDEEGILAGIKIIDLRCKFAMQMFDPYSSFMDTAVDSGGGQISNFIFRKLIHRNIAID
jgi:hypothetical protein